MRETQFNDSDGRCGLPVELESWRRAVTKPAGNSDVDDAANLDEAADFEVASTVVDPAGIAKCQKHHRIQKGCQTGEGLKFWSVREIRS